jgi:HlyD family secretion protein
VVPGMPVVTISDLAHVWLRASFNETDVGRVKLGQRIHVTTKKERANLVYRVKIDVANPALELKPGMRADADILWNEKCG